MKANELRKLLKAAGEFQSSQKQAAISELEEFADFISADDVRTVAAMVKGIGTNWAKLDLPKEYPAHIYEQLVELRSLMKVAGSSKAVADIDHVLSLFKGNTGGDVAEFVERLRKSKDFVPLRPATKKTSRVDSVVATYVERLQSSIFVPQVFSNILDELRDVSRISDARVSKIAKAFSGKGAKARANAIQNIVLHQNKRALEKGSKQALDNVGV